MPKTIILIVDGDSKKRLAVRRMINSTGHTALEAATAQEGLRKTRKHFPDVLLLSMALPERDRMDLIKQIKTDLRLKQTLIVLLFDQTASSKDKIKGLESGADGYLTRPISKEMLKAHINAFVRTINTEETCRRFMEIRLALIEYAAGHTLDELLVRALDEVGLLVDSPIGFYHFVESGQKSLFLQQLSTYTSKKFCRTEANGMHENLNRAGVWADCVRKIKPVIHNDYDSLPHKKGMPEGHGKVIRELVVPVIRENKVVAVLGAGNKPVDYTERDAEVVSYLADEIWEIVRWKRVETALREIEGRAQAILNAMPDLMFHINREGIFLDYKAAKEDLYTSPNGFLNKNIQNVLPPRLAKLTQNNIKRTLDSEEIQVFEYRLLIQDKPRFFESRMVKSSEDTVLAVIRDITEQKQAEKKIKDGRQFLQNVFDAIQDGISVLDTKLNVIRTNRWMEKMYTDQMPITGKKCYAVYQLRKSPCPWCPSLKTIQTGETHTEIVPYPSDKHPTGWIELTAFPIKDEKGRVTSVIEYVKDISDRKNAEEQIQKDLQEKNILLSEIHHRVKNSLQVVASLLNLQAREITNEHILNLFKQSRNRIYMMAAVYEKLYQSKNHAQIDFKDYLEDILQQMYQSSGSPRRINMKYEVQNVALGLDDAIPLALIINEMFTNSIKHAFHENRKGTIEIQLSRRQKNTYRLIYRDNGIGYPEHIHFETAGTLGLNLIKSLAEQIDGELSFEQNKWTTFTLTFKGYKPA
ncbi:MAG: GAF domain-containing protein [Candidatus Aminicenantes bacterium]|nr:GAF domain-containing protein [Candidatus Aminicenantes bacterium]